MIALDAALTAMAPLPGARPGGERDDAPELLVGEAGAEAIAKARAETVA